MSALRYVDSEAQQLIAIAQDVAAGLQARAQRLEADASSGRRG